MPGIACSRGGRAGWAVHCPQQRPQRSPQRPRRAPAPNRPLPLQGVACNAHAPSRVVLYDAYDHQIPYEQAWKWQKDMVGMIAARASSSPTSNASSSSNGSGSGGEDSSSSSSREGSGGSRQQGAVTAAVPPLQLGALLLLQHPPVYTLGTGATEDHLKFDAAESPLPLYRTERGGEVTYHGPGQLVLYPILDLRQAPLQPDLHWYLRQLEEVVVRALDAVSGLQGERIPGLTGVWVDGQKVAAIGVRASRWVTYHGLALNVVNDLTPFRQIVPCGISDRPVASVAGLLAAAECAAAAAAQRDPAAAGRAASVPAGVWEEDPLAAGFAGGPAGSSAGGSPAAAPGLGTAAAEAEPWKAAAGAAGAGAAAGAAAGADSDSWLPGAATAAALTELVQHPRAAQQEGEAALLEEYRHALLEAFEEVFGVQLVPAGDPASDDMAARLAAAAAATAAGEGEGGGTRACSGSVAEDKGVGALASTVAPAPGAA